MDSYRRSGITPVTCTYWRNSSCFKGDRCAFLHGYICRDDGICSDPGCNKKHVKQRDPSTYLKHRGSRQRHRSRSRSPYSRRSPYSPYSRRRSPRKRSRTPRRSYSPRRSHSHSNSSRGLSPRKSVSPSRKSRERSKSQSSRSSRSRSSSPTYSPTNKTESPLEKSRSFESPEGKDKIGLSKEKLKLIMDAEKNLDEALGNRNGRDNILTSNSAIGEIDPENKSEAFGLKSRVSYEKSSRSSLSPSLKALEILKNLPKDYLQTPMEENPDDEKEKVHFVKKPTEDDLFNEAFCKALNKGRASDSGEKINEGNQSSVLPPVLKHPLNAESLAKPFQEKLYGYEQQSNTSSSLWTPALDRSKNHNSSNTSAKPLSNWEIDTPYVGRKNRPTEALPVVENKVVDIMPPPAFVPVEEAKKKKKKKRRRSSSSSSSSSSEDEAKKNESIESALTRKKKILSKVWTLMAQKKKLEAQRDETVLNHKGDGKSLTILLKENGALSSEIDRQIFLMNQMVQTINEKLGMSKVEAQQQEFFFQPPMFKHSKTLQMAGKKMSEKSLQKSISKFLKPSDEIAKETMTQSPPRKSLKNLSSPTRRSKKSASPTRKSKKSQKSRSRSRSRSHERKESPSVEKKGFKKPDKKAKTDISFESQIKAQKKKKEPKKIVVPTKVKIESQLDADVEYSPSPAMKPHIKYIDQGMHWCKLCNEFLDTVSDYVIHLESGNHLENLQNDPKDWLIVIPKSEKEPVDVNAPVLTIPLQGTEFIHSFAAFYCSLCDSIIKSKEEAQDHSETKLHVSKYKDHQSRNPLYEASYVREKMAAFAKYSVDKERRKEKNPSLEHMKKQDFFGEIKNKTDEDIGDKEEHLCQDEPFNPTIDESSSEKTSNYTSAVTPVNAASIRVASRGSGSSSTSLEGILENEGKKSNNHFIQVDTIESNEIEALKVVDENFHSDKSENFRAQAKKNEVNNDIKRSLSEEEERKLQALKKRVAEYKENAPTNEVKPLLKSDTNKENKNEVELKKKDKESSQSPNSKRSSDSNQSSKLQIKKYSNVIIGKMPFLKKSKSSSSNSKSSQDNKNEESSFSPATEVEQRISKIFDSFKNTFAEDNQNSGVLPPTVPRNTEYITEIESCESGMTFIKKFGPTMNPQDYSDNDDSREEPMDISHDEHYQSEKKSEDEISHSVMDIPVPVDPKKYVNNTPVTPVESKLKVDMNNPHLSQLSAAAAMYKEAVSSYQSLSIPPPSPYIQMPPAVPPMMYPYNPQSSTAIPEDYMDEYNSYNPQPPCINSSYNPLPPPIVTGEYTEGLNPPPPGTEEGSSNSNPVSDGIDSPDSFLCQKTPPPPGTEDENLTLTHASTSSQQIQNTGSKPNGQDYFKDMLSDLPVLSYDNYTPQVPPSTKDETSQESLIQEGLELLEFADEDEKSGSEKVLRNNSPQASLKC